MLNFRPLFSVIRLQPSVLRLYYHTLKHLKPVQIYSRLWFRLYRPRPDTRPAPSRRMVKQTPASFCLKKPSMLGPREFIFLNQRAKIAQNTDWDSPELSRLWRYNLHYFDDLSASDADERVRWHRELIQSWTQENQPGQGTGWEPYPASLRMVNWIKWLLQGYKPEPGMLDNLAVQARWLKKRLEYHLLGNHLLTNAKALVFAGLFFQGQEADKFYAKGMYILDKELKEQILEDGGHFERSPMYHLIVLEDLLDLINLHYTYGESFPSEWHEFAVRMLEWSRVMRHPDGEIPFFNDAAFGIAQKPREIDEYAQRLEVPVPAGPGPGVRHLQESGYVRLEKGEAVLLADVGPVGPDYLPGHAHADTLSFELSINGRRVVVNSGTSEYGAGPERQWQRSTAAHSTVVVDGQDSSEVWGGFRVARRARIIETLSGEEGGCCWASAEHNGYQRLEGNVLHSRKWELEQGNLKIVDELKGAGRHEVDIIFHLAPGLKPSLSQGRILVQDEQDQKVVLGIDYSYDRMEANMSKNFYYPEFGRSVPSWKIRLHAVCDMPFLHISELKLKG